jgi:cell division protein FtsI/penicillin-binding protein 2
MTTRAARLLVVALAGLGLSACSTGPDAEPTVEALVAGLEEGDLADAPVQGDRAAYAAVLAPLGDDLRPEVEAGEVTVRDEVARVPLTWTWDLDGTTWTYDTTADLLLIGDRWQVQWSLALVEPSMEEGEAFDVDTVAAVRGDVVGAGGVKLVTARPVVRLGLDKTQVRPRQVAGSAGRIARALDLEVAPYVERAEAMGDAAFVEAIVLRNEDARTDVPPSFGDIPGAHALDDELPLAPTREFAAPILGTVGQATAEVVEKSDGEVEAGDEVGLSGLQARYDDQLRGTPGVIVRAVSEDGSSRTLHEVDPTQGEPLRTTLDTQLQEKAERALADVGPASAIVAIRPSDGAVLAAASGPGSEGLNTATFGQYAPGSTFKVVTSLALLRAGLTPTSRVACPATAVVDGKSFKNYDDYPPAGTGRITLRQAVADSCNTAFITSRGRLRDPLGGRDLADAAAALGLGVDHDLGFPAYFGQVPPPESETEAAADLIGQGTVLASPMAVAAVGASVAAGKAVLPTLLLDHEPEQTEPSVPLTGAEADALRALMGAVVTEGSGSTLAGVGVDGAKTGTAEYGKPGRGGELATHAWMLATRGDLAVAAFVEDGESGSQTAGPILQAFLS